MRTRIGYLVPQFPGQTHSFFWREIRALEESGVEVVLYSTRPPPPGIVAHDWSAEAIARTEYLVRRNPVAALRALPAMPWGCLAGAERGFARDLALSLGAAQELAASARRRGVGHVHVHSCARSALIAALAQRLGGPSYSLTLHGPLSYFGAGQAFKWRHARFATVVTRTLLAEVESSLGENRPARVVVQAMGVDTARFRRDAPYEPPVPGQPLRLFSCGRLNPGKGYQDLLAALRLLIDQGTEASLTIAGEDDEGGSGFRQTLEALIRDLGLGHRVRLLGAVDEGRVKKELLRAHLFVLASHEEALGVVFMEAMACGVPVIGTATGGVHELITPGQEGLLAEPQNPPALAEAIRSLASDPEKAAALASAGQTRVEREFDSRRGAETLIRELGWEGAGQRAQGLSAQPA